MHLPFWAIPVFAMGVIWGWAFLMPMPPGRGDFDFTQALSIFFRLAVCVVATLIVWLIYFMIIAWRPT